MSGIARHGDTHSGLCTHGAICCPHLVTGTIVEGSGNTSVNGKPVARLGDAVAHDCPHCGTGTIVSASGGVSVNGRGIARRGDTVAYPGGEGIILFGSENTFAG